MSKSAVPDVYARVIKDVCEFSRQDFEEGGVDLGALELLQQGWQKRLTNTKIATFPWEPKPEPVQKPEAPPAPSVKPLTAPLQSNGAALTPPSSHSTPGPHIKQENSQYAAREPPMAANYNTSGYPQGHLTAEQRASMHLQERFGPQAAPQIAQLSGQRIPPQANMQPHQQQPYIKQEYKQEDMTNHNYPPQNYNAQSLKNSQVDGAGDARAEYDAEIARRRALVAQHREAGDQLIRDRVLAAQQSLEGGGLMLPLGEQMSIARREPRRSNKSSLARAQGDAAGDDDEDEDAINSDLDDPDDIDETAADDDTVTNMMLCTYDKVQRVKNKWKCTLKDGILNVDGAEFVFHKGQGEFEW